MTSSTYPDGGTPPSSIPTTTAAVPPASHNGEALAFTGGDLFGLATIGLVLALLGAAVVRRSRRPRLA